MKPFLYALWAAAAGAGIPVMAVLNARLDHALGGPSFAGMALFAVGFASMTILSLLITARWPDISVLSATNPVDLAGGIIVGAYIFSITILAPRFGVANAVFSAAIDHSACSVPLHDR